jgi:hypothetical protein
LDNRLALGGSSSVTEDVGFWCMGGKAAEESHLPVPMDQVSFHVMTQASE